MQKTLKFLNYKATYVQAIVGIHVQSNFNDVFGDINWEYQEKHLLYTAF